METTNHEYHVSFLVAKQLKEAGFNWECRGYFDGTEFHPNGSVECTNYNSSTCKYFKAPTLDVAQRWLREVKSIEFDLCWHLTLDNQYKYAYAIKIKSIWKGLDKGKEIEVPSMDCLEAETCFNTFEEAQEAGIKKALEIILMKGK